MKFINRRETSNMLKDIVSDVFREDLLENARYRNLVDARRAYSKILRDCGFPYQYIADSLSLNHATIIHYVKTTDGLLDSDLQFRAKFLLCNKSFYLENKEAKLISDKGIYVDFIDLSEKLNEIELKTKKASKLLDEYLDSRLLSAGESAVVSQIKEIIKPLFET